MKLNASQAAFSQMLISGTLVHEANFNEIQNRLGIEISPHVVIVFSIDRYYDYAVGQPFIWRADIGHKLVKALHKAITVPFLWVWVSEGVLAALLELKTDIISKDAYLGLTLQMVHETQNIMDQQGFSVSAGIGTYYDNPYMLHYSYEEAKESMIDRFFQGNRLIFQYEKRSRNEKKWVQVITHEEKMELLARVRIGDEEGSIVYLKILLERLAQAYKHNIDMFKSETFDLIMTVSRLVLDVGGDASELLSGSARVIQDLYNTIRYDKYVLKVCDYWRKLARQVAEAHAREASPVIRSAIEYMKEHLQEKITLGEIARYCYLSTYHFAHLFKREVGLSFVDFLNKLRIEKAVHFLETTDLPVQLIAAQVGFPDPNYFTRKFKLYMSCSPSEYRAAKLC
ncbi:AraC family transcriptional regulator [Paenibacillus sp. LMG 31460]|uniref:AraC family transcriptional regulator n=1 Tax=Paenibacillus germinis TaxID=2654979 RepID=A0ABX1ZE63_9BACL|nr:helix-turn-helix domain-containing protein [Paenibacillus germinis]NOU90804.1 AraC family transcriptional regulator [Paenibacillus germinis]